MRPFHLMLALVLLLAPAAIRAEETRSATLYKTPWCGCCTAYGEYLEQNGFTLTVEEAEDLSPIKRQAGVPQDLEGCHTLMVAGYVVEGHVPVATLLRLLAEKPDIRGISLPGMPEGSPGMGGEKTAPFTIYEIKDGEPKIYARE